VQQELREIDLLARYGGEEFAVLALQTNAEGACVLAGRIRSGVEGQSIRGVGSPLRVTVSVGVTVTTDYPHPPELKQIIADADAQLYMAKRAGRNTWFFRGRPDPARPRTHQPASASPAGSSLAAPR
jgi:diguanylate cyclase (GGDEF)-like protein